MIRFSNRALLLRMALVAAGFWAFGTALLLNMPTH